MDQFSPRKRRCFLAVFVGMHDTVVFSAQAEVFLEPSEPYKAGVCFLRASGGVSLLPDNAFKWAAFSPRKRRCFHLHQCYGGNQQVFSAQAEVFLSITLILTLLVCFLRASGGVSGIV